MEMVERTRQEILMDPVVPARRQVDILAIAWLLLLQRTDQEKVDRALEVLRHGAILLRTNPRRIDRFGEVCMAHLLPVGKIGSLEHITELGEALGIAQIDRIRSENEIGDGSVEEELGSKTAVILKNFDLLFRRKIVALQLVGSWEHCLSVPGAMNLKEGRFFIYACHLGGCNFKKVLPSSSVEKLEFAASSEKQSSYNCALSL